MWQKEQQSDSKQNPFNINIFKPLNNALDKTGTITNGKPGVEDMLLAADIEERECLEAAAAIEKQSGHPLAKAIVEYAEAKGIEPPANVSIEETSGFGVLSIVSSLNAKP